MITFTRMYSLIEGSLDQGIRRQYSLADVR